MGNNRSRRFRVPLAAAAIAGVVLAGCGSSSSGGGSSSSGAKTSAAPAAAQVSVIPYSGPEATLPSAIPAPTKKPGYKFTLGYLQIYGGVGTLVATGDQVEATVHQLGGTFIEKDANLNAQNQVSLFDQFVSQHVSAIVVFPVDPAALGPELKAAAAAKIPVIAENATTEGTETLPSGYRTTINEALDTAAYSLARRAAQRKPGGSFVVMGTSLPIPTVQYEQSRLAYWGKKLGLKELGQVSNNEDNPTGYAAAATTLAARYPKAQIVFAYDDPYALAVAQTLRASNITGTLISSAIGGEKDAFAALHSDQLDAVYAMPWRQIGEQSVDAAYDVLTDQHVPLAPVVFPRGTLVTSANVASIQSVP